jgi:type IV secretory pathway ATPase VirB11/archaellum biosynthesis ATPase
MIKRDIEPVLRKMASQFKAVVITGPRQSGKTTLATDWFKAINQWTSLASDDAINPMLIYGGNAPWKEGTVTVTPWKSIQDIANKI